MKSALVFEGMLVPLTCMHHHLCLTDSSDFPGCATQLLSCFAITNQESILSTATFTLHEDSIILVEQQPPPHTHTRTYIQNASKTTSAFSYVNTQIHECSSILRPFCIIDYFGFSRTVYCATLTFLASQCNLYNIEHISL